MPLILSGNVGSATAATGYDVANSVRFNDGDSAYMHKTAAAGNRRTFTFSTWFKRGQLGTNQQLFNSYSAANAGGFAYMQLEAIESGVVGDRISLEVYGTILLKTTQVLRDPSSWYHLVIAVDTTSGTANNRCRMYLNGTEITDFVTRNNPDQNFDFAFNQNNIDMYLGSNNYGGNKGNYFDGYMAEVVWIDGTQYAASDFGEFDEDSGIWKPLESVSDLTFGTNGFYLDFKASGNLGNDANGGTDLTESGLAATDQSLDTCTNNFATMNPLDNFYYNGVFSEGNLKIINGSGREAGATSTIALSSGKWFWEAKPKSNVAPVIGIASTPSATNTSSSAAISVNGFGYLKTGKVETSNGSGGSNVLANYAVYVADDIIGVALDLDSSQAKVYFYKNGTLQGSGVNITSASATTNGHYFVGFGVLGGQDTFEVNFGSPPYANSSGNADGNGFGDFEYAVPSGYFAICTKNLAEYG